LRIAQDIAVIPTCSMTRLQSSIGCGSQKIAIAVAVSQAWRPPASPALRGPSVTITQEGQPGGVVLADPYRIKDADKRLLKWYEKSSRCRRQLKLEAK
jgi:hypothetical protein